MKSKTAFEITSKPAVSSSNLLADALRGLMKLLDDGDLVRNIEDDGDVMVFMHQSVKITNALRAAQDALDAEASAKL